MSTTLKAGLLLGVLVVAWTFVMGFTGWYKDPVLLNAFWVVILIQIGVLIRALRKTAAEGNTYGKQVWAGTLLSTHAAIIIFCGSYLFTTVAFPSYFADLRAIHEKMLLDSGMAVAEVQKTVEAQQAMQTPFFQALFGAIGTIVTGVVVSSILGLFFKKKPA